MRTPPDRGGAGGGAFCVAGGAEAGGDRQGLGAHLHELYEHRLIVVTLAVEHSELPEALKQAETGKIWEFTS